MSARKLPTVSSLERVEPPSTTVADAQRRALAREVADKPGFGEALADLERLDPRDANDLPAAPRVSGSAAVDPEPTAGRATLKTKPVPAERVTARVPRGAVAGGVLRGTEGAAAGEQPKVYKPRTPRWLAGAAILAVAASLIALLLVGSDPARSGSNGGVLSGAATLSAPSSISTETAAASVTVSAVATATVATSAPPTTASAKTTTTASTATTTASARPTVTAKPGTSAGLNGNWGWK